MIGRFSPLKVDFMGHRFSFGVEQVRELLMLVAFLMARPAFGAVTRTNPSMSSMDKGLRDQTGAPPVLKAE